MGKVEISPHMDLEAGIYKDDPEFEEVIDRLSTTLFQISSTNGRIAEFLRRQRVRSNDTAIQLVQDNQLLFRQLKPEIEEMQLWTEPTPSQKYSQHKLAADFAKLFKEFKQLQERVVKSARNEQEYPSLVTENSNSPANNLNEEEDQMYPLEQQQLYHDDPITNQETAFDEQLRQDEVSYQQGLVAERDQEIENIAQGMNELNEIFENLGEIVREQGVTLDNIESNMYTVSNQVQGGSQQLTKAHRWQRATSGRMCCFLIILLIMLLVVVIAVSF